MKILFAPMASIAETSGPFSRVEILAKECIKRGHKVAICAAKECNYRDVEGTKIYSSPIPSPFGMPQFLGRRMFKMAQKTGMQQKKAVNSFEEVLNIVGAISNDFYEEDVFSIIDAIKDFDPDIVYSEFRPAALTAAKMRGKKSACSISYPAYFSSSKNKSLSNKVKLFNERYGLPKIETVIDVFDLATIKFVPSIFELEPFEGEKIIFTGPYKKIIEFLNLPYDKRNKIVVYMGNGTVTPKLVLDEIKKAFQNTKYKVYISSKQLIENNYSNIFVRNRLDFNSLLSEALVFINHGGQNSIMDGIIHNTPQIICPGNIFERKYNGKSIEKNGAGKVINNNFNSEVIKECFNDIINNKDFYLNSIKLGEKLKKYSGSKKVIDSLEKIC